MKQTKRVVSSFFANMLFIPPVSNESSWFFIRNYLSRYSCYGSIIWHIFSYYCTCAYGHVVTYVHTLNNTDMWTNVNVVANYGIVMSVRSDWKILTDVSIVTYYRTFVYNCANSMTNIEPITDLNSWIYLQSIFPSHSVTFIFSKESNYTASIAKSKPETKGKAKVPC